MDAHHRRLLAALKRNRRSRPHPQSNDSYLSSGHFYYDVSVPARRAIAKAWLREHKDIPYREFLALLDGLYRARSHEEKMLASILLQYHRAGRRMVAPKQIGAWLDHLAGWAEIDSLIVFTANDLLEDWKRWPPFIRRLARARNINKRRAAIVLLIAPLRNSDDPRFASLGFETIDALKGERDAMITRAMSWLLRTMTQHHTRAVSAYLDKNRDSLPPVVVRETTRKIATGRK